MNITGMNHFAILTNSIDETVSFYEAVLGFKLYDCVKDLNNVRHMFLKRDGFAEIELIEGNPDRTAVAAFSHLALDVSDVDEAIEFLESAHITIKENAVLEEFNTRMISIEDPNGIVIALRKNLNGRSVT